MEEKELCTFFSNHFQDYKMGQGRKKEVYHTSASKIRAFTPRKKGYPERRWSLWLTSEWVILIPAADTDATSHSEKRINGLMDFTPDNVYSVIHINNLRCQNKLLNSHPIFSIDSAQPKDVMWSLEGEQNGPNSWLTFYLLPPLFLWQWGFYSIVMKRK